MSDTHYTAVIEIHKSTPATGTRGINDRTKVEVARIVVRADTLNALVRKTSKHLELVDE